MSKLWLTGVWLIGVISIAAGQTVDSVSNTKVAVGISTNAYRGDLGQPYDKWTMAVHGSLLFNHQRRLHGGIHLSIGSLTGQANNQKVFNPDTNTPNRYFKSTFFSAHYALAYDIVQRTNFVLYVSQGLGFIRFIPHDQFNRRWQDNFSTRAANETYGNVAAMLPTHIGATYFFPNRFGIGTKVGFYNLLTDYMDNVSQLGSDSGNDNAMQVQFLFFIPATF
uniref:Uncharacterized protein n=1 Tax=Roseihalotalea indica TaxID=2867963 RepID=A0AA49GRV6_9BACT|nr:hypothetical protein K4G66_11870 [Tunicatimonas sp. TK19036]